MSRRIAILPMVALLVHSLGCNSSPYELGDFEATKNRIHKVIEVPEHVEIVLAQHSSSYNDSVGMHYSRYRIGLVYSGPLQNKHDADKVKAAASLVCNAVLDLVDEDKQKASYPQGKGSLSVFVHETRSAHDGYVQFQQKREQQLKENRGIASTTWEPMSQKFVPLLHYTCSGNREMMELELSGDGPMSDSLFVSQTLESLAQGLAYEPPYDVLEPAQQAPSFNLPVTQQPWDNRLDGTWRFPDNGFTDSMRFFNGTFQAKNRAGLGTEPAVSQGAVKLVTTADDDTLLVLISKTDHGNETTQSFLVDFIDDKYLLLNLVNHPFRSGRVYSGAGNLLVRVDENGDTNLSDQASTFVKAVNEFLGSHLVDGRLRSSVSRFEMISGIVDPTARADAYSMTGYWYPSDREMNAGSDKSTFAGTYRYYFQDGVFYEMTSGPYTLQALFYTIDPSTSPKQIDVWVTKDGRQDLTKGIYRVSDEELWFCWGKEVRPSDFADSEGSRNQLLKLKRLTLPLRSSDIDHLAR